MLKTQKFTDFLESMKIHNPALVEAIQHGFSVWMENQENTTSDLKSRLTQLYNMIAEDNEFNLLLLSETTETPVEIVFKNTGDDDTVGLSMDVYLAYGDWKEYLCDYSEYYIPHKEDVLESIKKMIESM